MRLDMFNDVGHLVETDKPTKAPWPALCAGSHSAQERLARTTGGADKDRILAKTVKGIVSFLQNLLSPLTRKEGVRPVPKASRLVGILQTAGLLFAPLLPHLAAQISGTTSTNSYTLQDRDEIAAIKIGGVWKKIADWLKNLFFGGAAGTAIWDAIKAKWNAQPFTPSSGTVVDYAEVVLTDLNSETIWGTAEAEV